MIFSEALNFFFLSRTVDGYSPSTLKMYRWALDLMKGYVGDREISQITALEMKGFFAYIRMDYIPNRHNEDTSPLKGRSLENIWTAMRSFWGWAAAEFQLKDRPDLGIQRPKYIQEEVQPYTLEEVTALLKACDFTKPAKTERRTPFTMPRPTAMRDKALVLFLLDTGLRASECARLIIENVNMETGEVIVKSFGSGKKSRPRTVHMGKTSLKAVWRYLAHREADGPLFATREGHPMDRRSIFGVIRELGDRAGIKGANAHRFRHTFAIQFLRNGGDVFSLQTLLGHHDLDMVRRYLSLASIDTKNAHRSASPADRWKF